MLVRDGAAIPHARLAQSTERIDWSEIELGIFGAGDSAEGHFCHPEDGEQHVLRLARKGDTYELEKDPLAGKVSWKIGTAPVSPNSRQQVPGSRLQEGSPPTPYSPRRGLSATEVFSETLPVRRRVHSAMRDIPRSMIAGMSKPPSGPKDPPVQSSGPPCSVFITVAPKGPKPLTGKP